MKRSKLNYNRLVKIIFITGSEGKVKEARTIIPDLKSLTLDLTEIQEVDPHKIIIHKLDEAKKVARGNLVVEDTSLFIEGLNGLPGPLIKWFMKTVGNEGLFNMTHTSGNPNASAKTIVGLSNENGATEFFEGEIKGKIVSPRGANGFGWDSIFEAEKTNKTFAEMTEIEKTEISMRKIAFEKLKDYILSH